MIEISSPPFEVSESGWGEFEATIRIEFVDPCEEPVVLTQVSYAQFLRLLTSIPACKAVSPCNPAAVDEKGIMF